MTQMIIDDDGFFAKFLENADDYDSAGWFNQMLRDITGEWEAEEVKGKTVLTFYSDAAETKRAEELVRDQWDAAVIVV